MGILTRLITRLTQFDDRDDNRDGRDAQQAPSPYSDPVPAKCSNRCQELTTRCGEAERRAEQFFDGCVKACAQRDQWIKLYHVQAAEHARGQLMLTKRLEQQATALRAALLELNKVRKEKGEAEIVSPASAAAAGWGLDLAEAFIKRHLELSSQAQQLQERIVAMPDLSPLAARDAADEFSKLVESANEFDELVSKKR